MKAKMIMRVEGVIMKNLKIWPDGRVDGLSLTLAAQAAINQIKAELDRALFDLGPCGGHGERSHPSIEELFEEAGK